MSVQPQAETTGKPFKEKNWNARVQMATAAMIIEIWVGQ